MCSVWWMPRFLTRTTAGCLLLFPFLVSSSRSLQMTWSLSKAIYPLKSGQESFWKKYASSDLINLISSHFFRVLMRELLLIFPCFRFQGSVGRWKGFHIGWTTSAAEGAGSDRGHSSGTNADPPLHVVLHDPQEEVPQNEMWDFFFSAFPMNYQAYILVNQR